MRQCIGDNRCLYNVHVWRSPAATFALTSTTDDEKALRGGRTVFASPRLLCSCKETASAVIDGADTKRRSTKLDKVRRRAHNGKPLGRYIIVIIDIVYEYNSRNYEDLVLQSWSYSQC